MNDDLISLNECIIDTENLEKFDILLDSLEKDGTFTNLSCGGCDTQCQTDGGR